MLGLEAEPKAMFVLLAPFTHVCTVEEIARIELYAGLGRQHFHNTAARFLIGSGCQAKRVRSLVQNPVVIVPSPVLELIVRIINTGTDCSCSCEIHRRPFHAFQLASRDEARLDRRESAGIDEELVIDDTSVSCSSQIEIDGSKCIPSYMEKRIKIKYFFEKYLKRANQRANLIFISFLLSFYSG